MIGSNTDMKILNSAVFSGFGGGSFVSADDKIFFAYTSKCADSDNTAEILIRESSDGGDSWSDAEKIIFDSAELKGEYSGVSLLKMNDGRIGLFFVEGDGTGWKSRVVFGISEDRCKSFSLKCADCSFDLYSGLFIMENGSAIQLESGRILLPLCYRFGGDKGVPGTLPDERAFVGFSYSDDGGEHFLLAQDDLFQNFAGTMKGLRHPGVIEVFPNILHAYFSTDRMCQYSAFSTDGGLKWTQCEPNDFTSPSSPMKIVKNRFNGKYYGMFNPVPEYIGRDTPPHVCGRTPIVFAEISGDSRRPEKVFPIGTCINKGYTDPTMFFISENEVILSYSVTDGEKTSIVIAKSAIIIDN